MQCKMHYSFSLYWLVLFSLTSLEGNRGENYDSMRALLLGCLLTQIQYHNYRALTSVPLQPIDPCLDIHSHPQHHNRRTLTLVPLWPMWPLPRYHTVILNKLEYNVFHNFSYHFLIQAYSHIHYAMSFDLYYVSCTSYICSCINNSCLTHHIKVRSHTFLPQAYDYAWVFMWVNFITYKPIMWYGKALKNNTLVWFYK